MVSKGGYYAAHAAGFRADLGSAVRTDLVRDWHRRSPARHFAVAVRQFVLLGLVTVALVRLTHPALWMPLAVLQGFTVFNFTVLLHEVVHHAVFARRRPALERLLGYAYAVPSGISASQFTRWHLDHHAELGSSEDDPKRRHLSPKTNARWLKLLYCTPALFPIYFRAARRETANYDEALRRTIARERWVSMAAHLLALASIAWGFGWGAAARAYAVPVFVVFPVAFTLNRLGQHYSIDPNDPAGWSTLMRGHWFWDVAFLNSNYHLEHHYFPGVPFYRLPEVQRALAPYYERKGLPWRTYGQLLRGWFIENRAPHTDWRSSQ
ncbi:MAG: fatty acid desaturase [Vicinamibacterales bacterium]|nr:fatty acid desaturase [Vicinamibacterales bacterium]